MFIFSDSAAHDAYQPAIPVPDEIYKRLYSYGTISSAKVASDGVVTLTAPAKGKLIIDGTLDIECNY